MLNAKPKVYVDAHSELIEVCFDLTLIVSNDNVVTVVDNAQQDYHDLIDSNTLTIKKVKITY